MKDKKYKYIRDECTEKYNEERIKERKWKKDRKERTKWEQGRQRIRKGHLEKKGKKKKRTKRKM